MAPCSRSPVEAAPAVHVLAAGALAGDLDAADVAGLVLDLSTGGERQIDRKRKIRRF